MNIYAWIGLATTVFGIIGTYFLGPIMQGWLRKFTSKVTVQETAALAAIKAQADPRQALNDVLAFSREHEAAALRELSVAREQALIAAREARDQAVAVAKEARELAAARALEVHDSYMTFMSECRKCRSDNSNVLAGIHQSLTLLAETNRTAVELLKAHAQDSTNGRGKMYEFLGTIKGNLERIAVKVGLGG